jgi:hypothetical protein
MNEFLLVEADERAPQRLRRIALERADSLIATFDAVAQHDGPAIHDARRLLKELRALTSILRSALPGRGKAERKIFRAAGRELSSARDAKAALEAFDRLRERFATEWKPRQFQKIRRALAARIGESISASAVENLRAQMILERGHIAAWPVDEMRRDELWRALGRSYRRARRQMSRALEQRTAESIHEWRKLVKVHWYHEQFLTEVKLIPEQRAHIDAVGKLSRTLGHHHDLVLIDEICKQSPEVFGSRRYVRAFRSFVARALEDLLASAEKKGDDLFREPTRDWINHLRQTAVGAQLRVGPKKAPQRPRNRAAMLA